MSIRRRFENLIRNYRARTSTRKFTVPLVASVFFTVPPVLNWLATWNEIPLVVVRFAAVAAIFVTMSYGLWLKGYHFEDFDPRQFGLEKPIERLQDEVWTDGSDSSEQVLLTEYNQIMNQIQSHNSMAIRASYFSLATLGILATVFFSLMNSIFQPFVAEFGMFISFAFLVVTEKNVMLRDAFRSRQLFIERKLVDQGTLTSAQTWDLVLEYGQYPATNLSEQLVDFHKFWLAAWAIGYHASTVFTAFSVLQS